MTKIATLTAALSCALALPAFALDVDPVVDTDGDGLYSFPELSAAYAEVTEDMFITIDVNGDGVVDLAEMEAAQAAELLPYSDS